MKKLFALVLLLALTLSGTVAAAATLSLWVPPGFNQARANAIAAALSGDGITVQPRIAGSYTEILGALQSNQPTLVYSGSFVQAIVSARNLGTPMVQSADGKEMYAGILVCPSDKDPATILRQSPQQIAYAIGASSGESTAKAATGGKANIGVNGHTSAVQAVLDGRAQAAVVKDWWWLDVERNYPNLRSYRIPTFSEQRNADNVLAANRAVSKELVEKLTLAAMVNSTAFGERSVVLPFESSQLSFSLELMRQGGIDPMTYSW